MTESLVATTVEKLLHVKIIGEPTEEAYNSLLVQAAEHVYRYGEICVLLEVSETASRFDDRFSMALWEYAVFNFNNWNSVKRISLVGDPRWAAVLAVLCEPFTPAMIRYFERTDLMGAKRWAAEP
jgi:hypothetical protein